MLNASGAGIRGESGARLPLPDHPRRRYLRTQKLLLSRLAEKLPDFAETRAHRPERLVRLRGRGADHRIAIEDIHLEEDAGKLVHPEEKGASGYSLVDFNRAGVPLLEIVSGPEMHNIAEAEAYMTAMRQLLLYIGASEARMEKGQIRFEANISVRPKGTTTLGKRVEIKNLNSFRTVRSAAEYEIERQTEAMSVGEPVLQETRLWDEARGITLAMRSKEESHDYRYFPEPDLVPIVFTRAGTGRAHRRFARAARRPPCALHLRLWAAGI